MYVDPGINTSASNLKWVLPYCKPDLPRVVGALLLFIANNTMALTIPILSGIIVDRVIVGGHADELPRLCGLMILMTIIRVGARYGYQMWMERFGQNSVYRLVSDEYEKLHELDFTYFNHTRTGDIMSRLTSDTDAIRHCLSWVSYQIADCVVMFVGALCVMFAIDWRLALVLACVTPFIFVLTRGLSTHAHPLFFAIRNSLASLNSMVEENIEGNRVVKAFVREPYETEKFDEHNDDYMQCNMALAYNSRKYMPWLDGLGFSLQLITLGLGGFLVIKGYMTLGNLVSFNSFLWMIDGPVRQSGWLINDWQRFNASCIKIRKLLTEQPRIVEKPDAVEAVKQAVTIVEQVKHDDEATGATGAPVASGTSGAQQSTERKSCPLHIKGDIRFDHVSFAFPDDPETPILKDLDFTQLRKKSCRFPPKLAGSHSLDAWGQRLGGLRERHRHLLEAAEIVASFGFTELLVQLTGSQAQFRVVDFRLAFIVLAANVYGLNAGVAAALLASASLAVGYWKQGASPLLLFYEPSNWLAFLVYFVVGAVCGYVQLRSAENVRFAEEQCRLLEERLRFVRQLYQDVMEDKRSLRRQILGRRDSFGKVYAVTRALNETPPDKLPSKTVELLEDVFQNRSAAFYFVDAAGRIGSRCGEAAALYGERLSSKKPFSDEAREELAESAAMVADMYDAVLRFLSDGGTASEQVLDERRRQIVKRQSRARKAHFRRVGSRQCAPENKAVYNQLLLCLERAGNECSNLVEHGAELSMWGDALGADRPGSHDGGAPPVAKRSEAPVDELAEALA